MFDDVDDVLRDRFGRLNRTVDDLLCHPADAQRFAEDVARQIPGAGFPVDQILQRLMALRKRGEDKGGLPRTRR